MHDLLYFTQPARQSVSQSVLSKNINVLCSNLNGTMCDLKTFKCSNGHNYLKSWWKLYIIY